MAISCCCVNTSLPIEGRGRGLIQEHQTIVDGVMRWEAKVLSILTLMVFLFFQSLFLMNIIRLGRFCIPTTEAGEKRKVAGYGNLPTFHSEHIFRALFPCFVQRFFSCISKSIT